MVRIHPGEHGLDDDRAHEDVDREPDHLHEGDEEEHGEHRRVLERGDARHQQEQHLQDELPQPCDEEGCEVEREKAGNHAPQGPHRPVGERDRELRDGVARGGAQRLHPEAHQRGEDEEAEDRVEDELDGLLEHGALALSPFRTPRRARASARPRRARPARTAP